MIGRKSSKELAPPPNSKEGASEVLNVWAQPRGMVQVSLRTMWDDPATWGILLADVARHTARAYQAEGLNESAALSRIIQLLQAELADPTDSPHQLS
jgi:hypothetical protein